MQVGAALYERIFQKLIDLVQLRCSMRALRNTVGVERRQHAGVGNKALKPAFVERMPAGHLDVGAVFDSPLMMLWVVAPKPVQFFYHYVLPHCFGMGALALAVRHPDQCLLVNAEAALAAIANSRAGKRLKNSEARNEMRQLLVPSP